MSKAALDSLKLKIEKFRAERPHKKTPFPADIALDVKILLKTYKPGRLIRVAKVPASLIKGMTQKDFVNSEPALNLVRVAPLLMSHDTSLSVEISFAAGHSARVTGALTAQDVSTILTQLAGVRPCLR